MLLLGNQVITSYPIYYQLFNLLPVIQAITSKPIYYKLTKLLPVNQAMSWKMTEALYYQ